MPIEHRTRQLVEEALDSDRTPDEVCRDCPELLDAVRSQWERVRAVEAQMDALFPGPDDPPPDDAAFLDEETGLPRVEGYDVEAVLGRGGMGVVYRARHRKLNRPVALKMILAGAYASPPNRARFQREAVAVAALRHPNIVQVYDSGEAGGRPYFTMELVEGGTLADRLAGTPLPTRAAAELVAALAGAVELAHANGVVHRDLKPANVLLTADGTAKVTDFGLARYTEGGPELTLSGTRVGTPSYMAPEQALGRSRAIGPATDVYALGAILYELLTGRPPFKGESAAETERQVLAEDPVPPSRLNAQAPRDLETICLTCLHKEPRRRYLSAAALRSDLQRFVDGRPITARRVGRLERVVRWMRRNPTATALIGTSALLAVLALGAGLRERELAVRQRADLARWSDRLAFVRRLQEEDRFAEARAMLLEADPGAAHLQSQIEQARANLDLTERLDAVRLGRGFHDRGRSLDYAASSRRYAAIFREAGLGDLREETGLVAQRLAASPIRRALIAALDDWAACADRVERDWILGVARTVDPDPWRDRVRDGDGWARVETFPDLANAADVRKQPVTLMVAFGTRWRRLGGDPTSFLERVQRQYPNDFWVNFELGHLMEGARRRGGRRVLPGGRGSAARGGDRAYQAGHVSGEPRPARRGSPPLPDGPGNLPRLHLGPMSPRSGACQTRPHGRGDRPAPAGPGRRAGSHRGPPRIPGGAAQGGPPRGGPGRVAPVPAGRVERPRRLARLRRMLPVPGGRGRVPPRPSGTADPVRCDERPARRGAGRPRVPVAAGTG
jgi:serine/threonine-protein kinase